MPKTWVCISCSQSSSICLIFSSDSLESDVRLFFRFSFLCYWEFSYFSLYLMRRWDQVYIYFFGGGSSILKTASQLSYGSLSDFCMLSMLSLVFLYDYHLLFIMAVLYFDLNRMQSCSISYILMCVWIPSPESRPSVLAPVSLHASPHLSIYIPPSPKSKPHTHMIVPIRINFHSFTSWQYIILSLLCL